MTPWIGMQCLSKVDIYLLVQVEFWKLYANILLRPRARDLRKQH